MPPQRRSSRAGFIPETSVAWTQRGYLYLLDRKKDMIITGGEMVFSSEVEAVLHQNPKVHECAVVGVPDDTYGEALLGVVVPVLAQSLSAKS